MSIKEKDLTKRLSDIIATDYIRVVDAATGASQDVKKELVTFEQSQISGLVDALAALTPIEQTSALKSMLAYVKADGATKGSGFTMGDLTALTIDNIKNGLHVATTPFDIEDVGTVIAVLSLGSTPTGEAATGGVINTTVQTIYTLNGTFQRTFISPDWGVPMYVGGSTNNINVTRAEAISLIENDKLTPSATYRITDHTDYEMIVLTAATSSSFFGSGIASAYVPKHFDIATYTGENWLGAWNSGLTPTTDNLAIYFGVVYQNLTGAVGTASGYALDAVNWVAIDRENLGYYNKELHGVIYDIKATVIGGDGFISKEWDLRGNEFGIQESEAGTYLTKYNQFGDPLIFNNQLSKCYNHTTAAGKSISGNDGGGKIYDTHNCNIVGNTFRGEVYNLRDYTITDHTQTTSLCKVRNGVRGKIEKTTQNAQSAINLSNASNFEEGILISESTIDGTITATVTGIGAMKIVKSKIGILSNTQVTEVTNSEVNSNILLSLIVRNSFIGIGVTITTDYLILDGCTFQNGCTLFMPYGTVTNVFIANGYNVDASSTSELKDRLYAFEISVDGASMYIGTGTFTIPTGATYNALTKVTGCVGHVITENGTGVNTSTGIFTVVNSGWHRFKSTSSVYCATNLVNVESIVCVNGTPVQAGYNIKTYGTTNQYINASFDVQLELAEGDEVSMKYRHNNGGTVTFTLGQINMELI